MLDEDETVALTAIRWGVCPFGLATSLPDYCDVGLRTFQFVYPSGPNSSVRVRPVRLAKLVEAEWNDICRLPQSGTAE